MNAATGLGNMVMKTPMLYRLKELIPSSEIDIITENKYGARHIIKDDAVINKEYIADSKESFEAIKKDLNHDLCLIAFDTEGAALTTKLYNTRIKSFVRHYHPDENNFKRLKRKRFRNTSWISTKADYHEIDLNYDLIKPVVNTAFTRSYKTMVSLEPGKKIIDYYDLKSPYIVIQAGVANGTENTRCWGPDNFILLIKDLLNRFGHQVVLVGDKNDYPINVEPIADFFRTDERIVNTCGHTSIEELKQILNFSALVVCHDSGVMHLANAFNIPMIALFGPSDYLRVRPLSPNASCLFSKTEYFQAKRNFKAFNESNLPKKCSAYYPMSGISVKELIEKCSLKLQ